MLGEIRRRRRILFNAPMDMLYLCGIIYLLFF
jgi:hypothetical protein